jgi:glycosyltransferase involved in cell wall biosynthesis
VRIVHISHTDVGGGAGVGAYRLHEGLRRLGHASQMVVANRWSEDPDVRAFVAPRDLRHRVRTRLRQMWMDRTFTRPYRRLRRRGGPALTDCRNAHGDAIVHQLGPADVVHLHWVAFLLDWPAFFAQVPVHTPVVWTLRDENPLTGACHYTDGCDHFLRECGHCPQLAVPAARDLSHAMWRRKQRALAAVPPDRLHLVTISEWLRRQAASSSLLRRFPVSTIANGVDVQYFAPGDRAAARATLGIPSDGRAVVLFVSGNLANPRKGFATLCEAFRLLSAPPVRLLSVGRDPGRISVPIPHVNLGSIDPADDRLRLAYAAADVVAVPSLHEGLSNVVLEALASGVPLVGSNVGGIPDLVTPGVTGLLVEPGDPASLSAALGVLLNDPDRRATMGRAGRERAVEDYSLEHQAARYVRVYEAATCR